MIQRHVEFPSLGKPSLLLPYYPYEIPARQRRLKGRYALEPNLDFTGDGFACSAEIDWLAIRFKLNNTTQWKYVNKVARPLVGRRPWVTGPNGEKRHTGDEFVMYVQTPKRKRLMAGLAAINEKWGIAGEPILEKLEFSVDFYPTDETEETRQMMVGVLQRHFLPPYDCMRLKDEHGRFVAPGKLRFTIMSEGEINAPFINATTYFGKRGGNVMWRIMDKETDVRTERSAKALKPRERRARIEVVLSKQELRSRGLEWLSDLDGYSFSEFRKPYFQFALPTFADGEGESEDLVAKKFDEMRWEVFAKAGVYGLREADGRQMEIMRRVNRVRTTGKVMTASGTPERFRMGNDAWMIAFTILHKRIVDSTRNLSWKP